MDFDIIVIGAGPGGYPAAIKAAKLGAKTAIVEREWLGGTCLNCGCIPTKTLIAGAEAYQKILHAESFGIKVDKPEIDYPAMKNRKDGVVKTLQGGINSLLGAHGITIFNGNGYSSEWHTEAVEKRGLKNLHNTPAALANFGSPKVLISLSTFFIFFVRSS